MKKIDENVSVFFCLYLNKKKYEFQIGFHYKNNKNVSSKELEDILSSEDFHGYISEITVSDKWIYGLYNLDKLLGSYKSMFNDLLKIIKLMEKKAKNIK